MLSFDSKIAYLQLSKRKDAIVGIFLLVLPRMLLGFTEAAIIFLRHCKLTRVKFGLHLFFLCHTLALYEQLNSQGSTA